MFCTAVCGTVNVGPVAPVMFAKTEPGPATPCAVCHWYVKPAAVVGFPFASVIGPVLAVSTLPRRGASWPPLIVTVGFPVAAEFTPVPVSATLRGLPGASSTICSVAVLAPPLVGRNVTAMSHVPPPGTVAHPAGSAAVKPEPVDGLTIVAAVMCSAPTPVLVTVTVRGADRTFATWLPNATDAGLTLAAGAIDTV